MGMDLAQSPVDVAGIDRVMLVRDVERRAKRDGTPFLRLRLCDRSGSVPAVLWDADHDTSVVDGDPAHVVIDLSQSHVWDASTVATLDAITTKYERRGTTVEIVGLDESSAQRHGNLTGSLPSH